MITQDEKRWISRAKWLMQDMPTTLRIYQTEGGMIVCKAGLPSCVFAEGLGAMCYSGNYLDDLHDDTDFGKGYI